jgi:hypothetical protein
MHEVDLLGGIYQNNLHKKMEKIWNIWQCCHDLEFYRRHFDKTKISGFLKASFLVLKLIESGTPAGCFFIIIKNQGHRGQT